MKRQRLTLAAVLVPLCLAGCGSGNEQRAAPPPPRLPRVVAEDLATRTDEIAQALDANDSCRASSLARVLQARTIAAINARRLPAAFQEPLAGTVSDLASRIRCVPPRVDNDQGHKGKDKAKGKHKHEEND